MVDCCGIRVDCGVARRGRTDRAVRPPRQIVPGAVGRGSSGRRTVLKRVAKRFNAISSSGSCVLPARNTKSDGAIRHSCRKLLRGWIVAIGHGAVEFDGPVT